MTKSARSDVGTRKGPIKRSAAKRRVKLTPEAQRALAEAEARRNAQTQFAAPDEQGGRGGLEPTRYGDWENKGVASDF